MILVRALNVTNQAQSLRAGHFLPIYIIFGTAAANFVFSYLNVGYGILISLGLVVSVYLIMGAAPLSPPALRAAESLVLTPMYMLLTSSLPWFVIDQQYLLPAVYSVILALIAWHAYRRGMFLPNFREWGFTWRRAGQFIVLGLILGIPTGVVEYLILTPSPATPGFELTYFLRDVLYMFAFVAVAEEVLFRGMIQKDLCEYLGPWMGIFLTALFFSIMHMTWRSVPELFFTLGAGLFLGYFRWKSGSLIGPLAWHGTNNVVLVAVMPYLLRLQPHLDTLPLP
ncbi:MAG: amino terminal protease family [Dehalococcoidia bacterium]|nr:amino terminal protease family [Dehalococcoidia bacterium]